MSQKLHLLLGLLSLNILHICHHPPLPKRPRQLRHHQPIGMKTSQSNKLPTVTQAPQIVIEMTQLLVAHTSRIPIKTRRQIISQHLMWKHSLHTPRKTRRVRHARILRLHPNHIRMRRVRPRAPHTVINRGFNPIIPLAHARRLPIEINRILPPQNPIRHGPRARVRKAQGIAPLPFPPHFRPTRGRRPGQSIDSVEHRLAKRP
mmetsp:Transcript_49100/g.59492  ORF Transcript_49100/g.59492 Transcript_49100/m.59492 type:complete len:204 (+) Transcript_49100:253-864(+)